PVTPPAGRYTLSLHDALPILAVCRGVDLHPRVHLRVRGPAVGREAAVAQCQELLRHHRPAGDPADLPLAAVSSHRLVYGDPRAAPAPRIPRPGARPVLQRGQGSEPRAPAHLSPPLRPRGPAAS